MSNNCVILLHGLARSHRSMRPLQRALNKADFDTVNIDYPSTRHPIEQLALTYISHALEQAQQRKPEQLHFVTHSMGGILLRYYLNQHRLTLPGRIVMLSPPNQGSAIVDRIGHWRLFKFINGPAGQQLTTEIDSLPRRLGAIGRETGIITGDRSYNPWLSHYLTGPNDGKVDVYSARLKGMRDFIVVPHSHSFIMNSRKVQQLVIGFLENGEFNRAS